LSNASEHTLGETGKRGEREYGIQTTKNENESSLWFKGKGEVSPSSGWGL